MPAKRRLRDSLFFSRLWWPEACLNMTLPVLVIRMRSLVPLCVFCFGITATTTPYYENYLFAGHLRRLVDSYCITKLVNNLVCQGKSQIFVSQFAAPEEQSHLNFVSALEEAGYFSELYL